MRLVDESRPSAASWEDEGRRIGAALDAVAAVVIVAATPDDAAAVALGIGAVQAKRRRVVVADLAGDTATLARLITGDDPHGLSDSFRYGVSLNKVAQHVGDGENLFILPSGTEQVVDAEIYRSDRWRRLVAGFREVGALLVLVTPDNAPALDALIAFTDGSVAVGNVSVPGKVIDVAVLRPPRRPAQRSSAGDATAPAKPRAAIGGFSAGDRREANRAATPRASRTALIGGGLVAAAIAAFIVFRVSSGAPMPGAARTVAADSVATTPRAIDSAAAAVAPDTPPIRNPADSANAAGYAIEIAKFSTPAGALMRVRNELPKNTAAATFGVVAIGSDGTLWYRVLAGATAAREAADSVLASLRTAKAIDDPTAGAVVRAPFAFRLESGVRADSVPVLARQYLARGVPAYALVQADGTATLYAGAFETADQAGGLLKILRAAGLKPVLVYRTGQAP